MIMSFQHEFPDAIAPYLGVERRDEIMPAAPSTGLAAARPNGTEADVLYTAASGQIYQFGNPRNVGRTE
jgi:hypothetical protein